jgi:hypothetical protein
MQYSLAGQWIALLGATALPCAQGWTPARLAARVAGAKEANVWKNVTFSMNGRNPERT